MKSILITGAGGFVGKNLIWRIDPRRYETIYCLSQTASVADLGQSEAENVKLLRGGLFDIRSYEQELASTDVVVHLAAVTGKTRPNEYFRLNVQGTRFLIENCRRLGVQKLLYVSSIAVRFPDKSRYYYAQSKEQAEKLVASSGLSYTIIRPTLILGPGAPLWCGLTRLAQLPVLPIFGTGKTLIQPIAVEDLANFITLLLDRDLFADETFELGGPEVISIEDFFKKIHWLKLRTNAPAAHLPVRFFIPILGLAEKLFFPLMPVTVGQLSSFRYDGIITDNRLHAERRASLKTIDEMLASLCASMPIEDKRLNRECDAFSEYLIGWKPSSYVSQKYREAHRKVATYSPTTPFDRFLLRFAATGRVPTKLADCYSRFLATDSTLRRKLILLLAILESSSPSHRYLDSVDTSSKSLFLLRAIGQELVFVVCFLLATALLAPFHVVTKVAGSHARESN